MTHRLTHRIAQLLGKAQNFAAALGAQRIFSLRYSYAVPKSTAPSVPREENTLGIQVRNSMMHITLLMAVIGATATMLLPSRVSAVDVINPACQGVSDSTACQSNTNQPTTGNQIYGPNGVLTKAASLIAVVVGIASVIMIIVGGFKYVTSSGDPNSVQSAKNTVLFAIVGMLVALTAQSLVVLVLRNL